MSQRALNFSDRPHPVVAPISPLLEMGAYESLWARHGMTFKKLAQLFRTNPEALPSNLVPREDAEAMARQVLDMMRLANVEHFGIRVHRAGEYPAKLRDAKNPVELLYYQGWWNLVEAPCVAVVGTRNPTEEGIRRAREIVWMLVEDGRTVVSGLAAGIDTVAHRTALERGGQTIAVIGTPLTSTYPAQNLELQRQLAADYLVISQVPVYRYSQQNPTTNRFFFPERNVTMSALTDATIIIEAGETSGTLIQARAALQQGRKLFILESCFQNSELTWPQRFLQRGAIRVRDYDDIRRALPEP
jgi:DNA processing protein